MVWRRLFPASERPAPMLRPLILAAPLVLSGHLAAAQSGTSDDQSAPAQDPAVTVDPAPVPTPEPADPAAPEMSDTTDNAALLDAPPPNVDGIPAQSFELDPSHSTVTFMVDHLGLSAYTAAFESVRATLELDPAAPESAVLEAEIDVATLDLPSPPEGFLEELLGESWFNAAEYPKITFRSTQVALTGPDTAEVAGELTMMGVTVPVTLATTFNAAYPAGLFEPTARIGFSATAALERSKFGLSAGIPEPGSTIGVGDPVTILIEAEFSGTLSAATP